MSEPVCSSPIDCDNIGISPEEVLARVVQVDANGCAALNIVVVDSDDPAELYINCDNGKNIDWQQLVYRMITTDANDNWAVRAIQAPAP